MDTSEQYIKMCDCEEIQNEASVCMVDTGRFFVVHQGDDVWCRQGAIFNNEGFCTNDARLVWLPRQDRLQEMVSNTYTPFEQTFELLTFCLVDGHICTHIGYEQTTYSDQFASMEQLWLAFVMKEKYNKTWDGEKWIN